MYRPKVGEECLVCVRDDEWHKAKINYLSKTTIVIESAGLAMAEYHEDIDHECAYHPNDVQFKPLKSEREEAIERIAESLRQTFVGSCYAEANRLYDAGLRFKEDNQDV